MKKQSKLYKANVRCVFAFAVIIVMMCCPNIVVADDDDPSGYARAGMKICPCFCSVRTGDEQSPYWDENFGDELLNEKNLPSAQCADSCLDSAVYKKHMPNCGDHVDYNFCPRRFNGLNNSNTIDYIKALDGHAKKCTDSTITMDFEKDNVDHENNCLNNIQAGACYIAFPKCINANKPVGTCSSFCVKERIGCRSTGSTYGHRDYLTSNCENDGRFVKDIDGNVDLCTGDGNAMFNSMKEFFKISILLILLS